MKKRVLFTALAVALYVVACFSAHAQDHMARIDAGAFERPTRSPAVFEHDEHNEKAGIKDCAECHHLYDNGVKLDGESSEDQRCAECHPLNASKNTTALRRAYHLSCRGCHTKREKGPVMCGQCHIKPDR